MDGRGVLVVSFILLLVDLSRSQSCGWGSAENKVLQSTTELTATSIGSDAVFAGGQTSNQLSSLVTFFDPISNTFTTSSLSQARRGLTSASCSGIIMFAGGFSGKGLDSSAVVDIYHRYTEHWDGDTLSVGRSHLKANCFNRTFLFAGGFEGDHETVRMTSDVVDIYDAETQRWSLAELSDPRAYLATTTVDHLIMFAGGEFTNLTSPISYSEAVDIYDAIAKNWSVSALSFPRSKMAATSSRGLSYFAGGSGNSPDSGKVVEIYDPILRSWNTTLMLQYGSLTSLTVLSINNVILFGSETAVEVLNLDDSTWTIEPPATLRDEHAGTVVKGIAVFYAGGETGAVNVYSCQKCDGNLVGIPNGFLPCELCDEEETPVDNKGCRYAIRLEVGIKTTVIIVLVLALIVGLKLHEIRKLKKEHGRFVL